MKRILLDADGCIAAWLDSACNLLGVDLNNSVLRNRLKSQRLEHIVGKAAMWSEIHKAGYLFWTNLNPYPWTKSFYTGLQQAVNNNVYICTAPSSDPQSAAGKMYWCKKHLRCEHKQIVITQSKWLLASPDSFLIDDDIRKVEAFRNAGGHAFLFPNALRIIDGDVPYGTMLLELTEQINKWLKLS